MKPTQMRKQAKQELKDMGVVLKGIADELKVQVHLAAMELKSDAGPYLQEVRDATEAATRDVIKRGEQLKLHLKKLRAAHRAR